MATTRAGVPRGADGSDLKHRLAALRKRLWFVATFRGVAWLLACVLLTTLAAGLLDWLWNLPALVRAVVLTGMLAGAGVIAYRLLFQPLSQPTDDLSLALRVEERFPALNDALASTMQFLEREGKNPEGESPSMRRETVKRALGRSAGLDFLRVVDSRGLWKAGLFAGLPLLFAALLTLISPITSLTALARLALPFSGVEWPEKTQIILDEYATRIGRNREYHLRGVVTGVIPKEAMLELTHTGFPTQRRPLSIKTDDDGESTFVMHLRPTEVHRDFTFTITANDAVTPTIEVKVLPLPSLEPLDGKPSPQLTLDVPAYTDLPSPQRMPPGNGHVDTIVGTVVTLQAATDRPLERAWIEYLPEVANARMAAFLAPMGSGNSAGVVASLALSQQVYMPVEAKLGPDNKRFSVTFRPPMHGNYVLMFRDTNDLLSQRQYELRLKPDPAPAVRMERPSAARDMLSTVLPGAELPLQVTVEDTMFAIRSVWLEYRVNAEVKNRIRFLYDHGIPAMGAIVAPRLRLQRLDFDEKFSLKKIRHADGSPLKDGDLITLRAGATDFDDVSASKLPGYSPSVEIRIVGRTEFEARVNQEQGQIQQDLQKLHQKERDALAKMAEIENRVRKGGKMVPDREQKVAEEEARKLREEAVDEELKAEKAEDEADKKKHREKAAELRKKADEAGKKAEELRKQTQQLAEVEDAQQQITRKIGDDREGLRADIERLRQTLKQNGMENSAAMERMTAVARELDRLAEKELPQIEPKLASARRQDQLQDENFRKEKKAELERKADQAEREAKVEEDRAKKLAQRAAQLNEEAGKAEDAAEQARKLADARNLEKQAAEARQKAGEKKVEAEKAREEANEKPDPQRARRELADARRGQEEVEKSLGAMLQDLEPWSSTREVKSEVAGLLKEQKELQARLEEMEQKGLTGKNPDELTREQKVELEELKEAQKRVADRTEQLLKKMERMAKDRADKDPETARGLEQAAKEARDANLPDQMRRAQESIGKNKLNDAKARQREAKAQLEKLAKNIEDRREIELDRLARKLKEAEQKVEELMDEQEKLQKKIREAEKIKDPKKREDELKRLAKKQQELAAKAEDVTKQIARLRSGRAQQALEQAAEEMKEANQQLSRAKADNEKQEDVLDRLDEARLELQRAKKQAEEELGREQLVRVADVITRIRDREQGLMQEAKRIQDDVQGRKGWSRGLKASTRDLGQHQKGLGEETGSVAEKDLSAAPVFQRLLQRVSRNMKKAGDRFGEMVQDAPKPEALPDAEADRYQKQALKGLQQLLDSIKEQQAENPRPLARNGGKEGDGGDGDEGGGGGAQGDNSLPPSAQLKLLRAMQKEVNDKTVEFKKKNPDADKLTDKQKAELQEIRREQQEVADLLEQLTRPPGEALPEGDAKEMNEKEGVKK